MKTRKPVKYRYIFFFMTTILSHATGWMIEESVFNFLQRRELFLSSIACRANLGPTEPPILWVRGPPRLRINGVMRPLPCTSRWRVSWLIKHRESLRKSTFSYWVYEKVKKYESERSFFVDSNGFPISKRDGMTGSLLSVCCTFQNNLRMNN
jgi:hypothetical protein